MTREQIEEAIALFNENPSQTFGLSREYTSEMLKLALIGLAVRESGVTADGLRAIINWDVAVGSDRARIDALAKALGEAGR